MRRVIGSIVAAFVVASCGGTTASVVVRGADDVQVMAPDDVLAARLPMIDDAADTPGAGASGAGASGAGGTGASSTIPLVVDDRPPELKLFDAFAQFRGCLSDRGYGIDGDLTDPNNPAYRDSAYLDAVQTCAARSDIVGVLQEVQSTRSNLTPDEVAARNEVFIELRACLEKRGWTVETRKAENGLIEPSVFQGPDGTLNDRDINQCLGEQNLG
jgi:hypothetical protein